MALLILNLEKSFTSNTKLARIKLTYFGDISKSPVLTVLESVKNFYNTFTTVTVLQILQFMNFYDIFHIL